MHEELVDNSHSLENKETNTKHDERKSPYPDTKEISENTLEKVGGIKSRAIEELDDFIDDSALKVKDGGRSIKRFGLKYFDMTKRELAESQRYLQQNIPSATRKLREEIEKNNKAIQGTIPKNSIQNKRHITGFVERMYGSSTIGRQYGPQSIKLLREIAELREEGLITESEYKTKKKELLRRI